ncbi:hypothetical protein LCGC14_2955970 [marine sediment metagenome]|uniref:Uncharacterized protein n=1 Tax=marine sediment metagenome TaxID=412755 RepID=A0A0F8XEG5_9ZZZZ
MTEQEVKTILFKDKTVIPQWDLPYITDNPEGLTKEGVDFNYNSWKKLSRNKYVIKKYEMMLTHCKNLKTSGKTTDGLIILARDEAGKPSWTISEADLV